MKPHNIREKMLKIIKMDDDEFAQKLFYDDEFMAKYNEVEIEYGNLLLKSGKRAGSLHLKPICKKHSNHAVLVTPSTRNKGEWQRTIFRNQQPMSHREYKTLEDVLAENAGEWFQHALWMEEGDSSQ